jgi:alcohol dehydrogenase
MSQRPSLPTARYHMPTAIVFGPGATRELDAVIRDRLRSSRPMLVTDKGIAAAGIAETVLAQLPGLPVFDEVEPNPKHTTVDRGGEAARAARADLVIGLGGGSALDTAKAVALLATNPGGIEDYEGRERYRAAPLPVIAIPTTCGTGSEVTWVAVITHIGRRFKMSIKGPLMYPAVALVDPDLLVSLPAPLVASTGLDALTHAIEALTARPSTFVSDTLALEAVRLIFRHLQDAYADIRRSAGAREGLMRGSLLAGMAFGNSDVGAVHCLAESVGSLYDTPHGLANAVFLPHVMEFNLEAAAEKYALIAAALGRDLGTKSLRDNETTKAISPGVAHNEEMGVGTQPRIEKGDAEAAARRLIDRIQELSRMLAIPGFREMGIPESDYPLIAQKSFENNSNPSNPRPAGIDDYLDILRRAAES